MSNTTLADAEQQLTAATATVDQLKAKILDQGPGTVTAEELGTAVLAVEHAKLTVGHAVKVAEENAAAERLDQLQLLRQQVLRDAGDVDTALDAMRQLEDAAALLIKACAGRQQLIAQATAAMRKAGVPQTSTPADEHAGLGWTQAAMGRGDTVHVDGRSIGHLSPGLLVAAALGRAARAAGHGIGHLAPVVQVQAGAPGAVDDLEAWLRARY